jgi:tetratricopeptide (TPR) repeat protein
VAAGSDVCLTDDEALAYAHATTAGPARLHLEAHLDHCDECRWVVSELVRTQPAQRARVGRYQIERRLGSGGMGVVYAAYDPQLDRKVAVKLVQPGADRDAQARLIAEARAMARLSHPGVVPIYDVSTEGDDVVLAMELVDGEDARRWLHRERPSWKIAVQVLALAGRGLAAAHAAGIVHRDVKPANILVGRDGRARITDFGLARLAPREMTAASAGHDRGAAPALFATGPGLIGTPAYMAPEQLLGQSATPRSDQFSFSVVLYEAVFGEPPFASAVPDERALDRLIAEVTAGRVRPPPPGKRVPAWLHRIVLRGLAVTPEDRWPSLGVMLDRIEETPRRRRRAAIAVGAIAAAIAVAGAMMGDQRSPTVDCTGSPDSLEHSFAGAAWIAARTRIEGLGAYGAVAGQEIGRALDGFRARWIAGHRDACMARRSAAQSDMLLDLRIACLERARASLGAAGEAIRLATASKLADMVSAVRTLPDPSACSDAGTLLAMPRPPATLAAAVAAVDAAIARIDVERRAGRMTEAHDGSAAAVVQARALGYRPLLARALLAHGKVQIGLDKRALAAPTLADATAAALEAGDDALAVEAWARGAYAKVTGGKAPADALAGAEIVEAMARRLRAPSFARALLENNIGTVELARGQRAEAAARFQRALVESLQIDAPDAVELLNVRSNAAMIIDDPVGRDAALAETEAAFDRWLGPDHPESLRLRTRRGKLIVDLTAARDLLSSACARYERYHVAAAASLTTDCWAELGYISEELGDRAGAIAALERVVRLPGDGGYISPEPAGYLLLFRGDARAASVHFERAIAGLPQAPDIPWWRKLERGGLELGLGRARLDAGDGAGARRALDRALADLSEIAEQHPAAVVSRRLASAYATHAHALRATGAPADRVADAARKALALLQDEHARTDEVSALLRSPSREADPAGRVR